MGCEFWVNLGSWRDGCNLGANCGQEIKSNERQCCKNNRLEVETADRADSYCHRVTVVGKL